jgi:hypothetical protein
MIKDFGSKTSFRTFGYCFRWIERSDSFFEIYTESYGDRPIVIQGAAGFCCYCKRSFGDILRLSDKG